MISFIYNLKPKNLFIVRMRALYPSFIGTINIIFCISMLILLIARFNVMNTFFRILVLILFIFFPIINPFFTYLKSIKDAENMKKDIKLTFDDKKWMVNDIVFQYSKIKISIIKFNFCLIYLDNREAYIVDKNMTDVEKLNVFINEKIKKL